MTNESSSPSHHNPLGLRPAVPDADDADYIYIPTKHGSARRVPLVRAILKDKDVRAAHIAFPGRNLASIESNPGAVGYGQRKAEYAAAVEVLKARKGYYGRTAKADNEKGQEGDDSTFKGTESGKEDKATEGDEDTRYPSDSSDMRKAECRFARITRDPSYNEGCNLLSLAYDLKSWPSSVSIKLRQEVSDFHDRLSETAASGGVMEWVDRTALNWLAGTMHDIAQTRSTQGGKSEGESEVEVDWETRLTEEAEKTDVGKTAFWAVTGVRADHWKDGSGK